MVGMYSIEEHQALLFGSPKKDKVYREDRMAVFTYSVGSGRTIHSTRRAAAASAARTAKPTRPCAAGNSAAAASIAAIPACATSTS